MSKQRSRFPRNTALDEATAQEIESNTEESDVTRRVMLKTLTMDLEKLGRMALEKPEKFATLVEVLRGYAAHAEFVAEIADTALDRVRYVGELYASPKAQKPKLRVIKGKAV
jgi:hypothetical protein